MSLSNLPQSISGLGKSVRLFFMRYIVLYILISTTTKKRKIMIVSLTFRVAIIISIAQDGAVH